LDGERQLLRTGLRQGAGLRFPGKVGVRPGGARAEIGKLRDRRPLGAPWRSWNLILRALAWHAKSALQLIAPKATDKASN
jgi:hypothetical protein